MGNVLYIAGYHGVGDPTGSPTKTAKVWKFAAGDSAPTDISDGLAGEEICCLEFDSTNSVLYAGGKNGKIYKYTGGTWSEEYDTGDSTRAIVSIKKLGSTWFALQSGRAGIDSVNNIYVWKQLAAGNWSNVWNTTSPQRASSFEVCTGGDGTFLVMGTEDPPTNGSVMYSSDGTTWNNSNGLSLGGAPVGHPLAYLASGTTYYMVYNCDAGHYYAKTTINAASWSGWGRPFNGTADQVNDIKYGAHGTLVFHDGSVNNFFFIDKIRNKIVRHQDTVGWVLEYSLPNPSSGTGYYRSGFAELDGVLYAVSEEYKSGGDQYHPQLYHRTGAAAWTADYNTTGTTEGDIFLDVVSGEELVMPIQFRTFQYFDNSVTQAKIEEKFAFVTRVTYSQVRADNTADPSGLTSVLAGQSWILNGAGSGDWSAWTTNDIVEALVDSPSSAADWAKVGSLGSGNKVRVSAANAAGSFASEENSIGIYNGSTWSFSTPADGVQCINDGSTGSMWEDDLFVYNADDATWNSISPSISIASSDNALEISDGSLGHVTTMGHNHNTVEYVVYSDIDQGAADPSATGVYSGKVIIANNCSTFVDGHLYHSDGTSWTQLSDNALSTGARIFGDPQGVEASCGMTAGDIQVLDAAGSFGATGDWTNTTPVAGDMVFVDEPEKSASVGSYLYERMTAIYNGSGWDPVAKWPDNWDGDGLNWNNPPGDISVEAYNGITVDSNGVSVDGHNGITVDGSGVSVSGGDGITVDGTGVHADLKTGAGLEIDTGQIAVVAQNSSATGQQPTSGDQLVTRTYVDTIAQGLYWKNPSAVLKMVSDATGGGSPPAASEGDAYVVNTWGAGNYENTATAYTDGDIAEKTATGWNRVVTNSGGYVPVGTQVIVDESPAGSFTGEGNNLAVSDGDGTWTFETATDGIASIIYADASTYADNAYTYTGSAWTQFSKVVYTSGNGLSLTGNQFSASAHDGIAVSASGIAAVGGDGITVDGTGIHVDAADTSLTVNGTGVAVQIGNGLGLDANGVYVDGHDGITVDGSGVSVDAADASLTVNGTGVAVTQGDGIYVDANGVKHYVYQAWEDPTDSTVTHQFADPGSANGFVEASVMVYRNGALQKEVTSGSEVSGTYSWTNSTRTMVVSDAFQANEEVTIFADLT